MYNWISFDLWIRFEIIITINIMTPPKPIFYSSFVIPASCLSLHLPSIPIPTLSKTTNLLSDIIGWCVFSETLYE